MSIMAAHQPHGVNFNDGTCGCNCGNDGHSEPPEWPCETYRLAEALQRVDDLATEAMAEWHQVRAEEIQMAIVGPEAFR